METARVYNKCSKGACVEQELCFKLREWQEKMCKKLRVQIFRGARITSTPRGRVAWRQHWCAPTRQVESLVRRLALSASGSLLVLAEYVISLDHPFGKVSEGHSFGPRKQSERGSRVEKMAMLLSLAKSVQGIASDQKMWENQVRRGDESGGGVVLGHDMCKQVRTPQQWNAIRATFMLQERSCPGRKWHCTFLCVSQSDSCHQFDVVEINHLNIMCWTMSLLFPQNVTCFLMSTAIWKVWECCWTLKLSIGFQAMIFKSRKHTDSRSAHIGPL